MEFLAGVGPDGQIADMLESYAPGIIFMHNLTRSFVQAYIRETRGEPDAFKELAKNSSPVEQRLLDRVYLAENKAGYSELEPVENLRKDLRVFWADAVKRKLGSLPMHGDEALERRRLELSVLMGKFRRTSMFPWKVASSLMRPDTLK